MHAVEGYLLRGVAAGEEGCWWWWWWWWSRDRGDSHRCTSRRQRRSVGALRHLFPHLKTKKTSGCAAADTLLSLCRCAAATSSPSEGVRRVCAGTDRPLAAEPLPPPSPRAPIGCDVPVPRATAPNIWLFFPDRGRTRLGGVFNLL